MQSLNLNSPVNLPDFADLDLQFDIVDSHHHLFDLSHVYYPWLTDKPEPHFLLGDYDRIKCNFLPADYRAQASGLRVVNTVHVEAEADHENSISETRWLDQIMRTDSLPNAVIAHAWLHRHDSHEELAAHAAYSAVRGIRSKPLTATDAASRSRVQGLPASMQDSAWRRGLGLLREFNFSWDLRVPFWHLEEAAEVCRLYPDLPVVVEHTGLPWDRSEAGLAVWRAGMTKLAALDHVYVKISELGLASDPWDYEDNKRIVLEAIELFGFERAMFASNFPVAGLRIGYRDQVCAIAHMTKDCSSRERNQLFCDTATRFYRLA